MFFTQAVTFFSSSGKIFSKGFLTMGFFDFLKDTPSSEPSEEDLRNELRETLRNTLGAHRFTEMEIKEVQNVIDIAEAEVQILKDSLVQVKLTNPAPEAAILRIKEEVELVQARMSEDIKLKIIEIKRRKALMGR